MNTPIKVFIFEDMLSFIDGFKMYVDRIEHIDLMDSATTEDMCLAKTKNKPLDIILLDIVIGKNSWGGFTVAEKIIARFKKNRKNPSIIFLTAHAQDAYIEKAKALNCSFVNKYLPMPEIIKAIEEVYAKQESVICNGATNQGPFAEPTNELALHIRRNLTPKQGQVAVNLYFLWNNADLAEKFGISKSTIETHLKKSYEQLGLTNDPNCREKLKKMVFESGLVNLVDSINKEPKKWFNKEVA